MDNHQRRPANICRYIYMLQRYEKPRTKQNHNAAKRNTPQRGCSVHTARPNIDNVDNMDNDGRRVEAIQAHRHEGQT